MTASNPSEYADAMARRYGREHRWGQKFWIGFSIVVSTFCVALGIWMVRHTPQQTTWVDLGSNVTPMSVSHTVQVSTPDHRTVVCSVVARNQTGLVVGRTDIRLNSTGDKQQRTVAVIPTTEPAVDALTTACLQHN